LFSSLSALSSQTTFFASGLSSLRIYICSQGAADATRRTEPGLFGSRFSEDARRRGRRRTMALQPAESAADLVKSRAPLRPHMKVYCLVLRLPDNGADAVPGKQWSQIFLPSSSAFAGTACPEIMSTNSPCLDLNGKNTSSARLIFSLEPGTIS